MNLLVRQSAHFFTHVEALQQTFVPIAALSSPFYRHHLRHRSNPLRSHPATRHYKAAPGSLTPTKYSRRIDEEIDEPRVQCVDEASNALLPPQSPYDILREMDRKTQFLVEMAPATDGNFAICRILPRQQVLEYERAKSKKPRTKETLMKQMEINWAIGQNDLQHKLDRLQGFLNEGRRVEMILAKKQNRGKKGKDPTREERRKLVDSIRNFARGLPGVIEWKPMAESGGEQPERNEMPKPWVTMLFFEGSKKPGSKTKGPDVEDETAPPVESISPK